MIGKNKVVELENAVYLKSINEDFEIASHKKTPKN